MVDVWVIGGIIAALVAGYPLVAVAAFGAGWYIQLGKTAFRFNDHPRKDHVHNWVGPLTVEFLNNKRYNVYRCVTCDDREFRESPLVSVTPDFGKGIK